MANQTLKDNSSDQTAIAWEKYLTTADYLIENPKETKNGWDYRRIETFLKFIVANANIKPDFDLEKASLQEVVNFLRSHPRVFSETEEHLESIVPSPELLKKLLEDWEEAQTKFNQERAANKLIETIEKISLTKRYQQIIRERLSRAVSSSIAEAIAKELPVDPRLSLALEKSEELPDAQKEPAIKEIAQQTQETVSTAIASLEQKMEIPPKERTSLSKIQVTASDLPKIASDLSKPPAQRKEIEKWLKAQFTVEESQNLAEILAPAVAAKIDFIRVSEKQIEEAVIISLAENAPEVGIIPSEKISKILAAFVPRNKEELKLWLSAKEEIPFTFLDEPIEVTSLPSKFPRFFTPPLQRSSPKEALLVQDSKGKSFMEQLRRRIFTEGIDKSNALQLRSIVLESWALYLTAQKISQGDLDFTVQRLIKSGENPDSPRIRELRELREALIRFQANLPPKKLLEIKETGKKLGQQGSFPVSFYSGLRTVILRKDNFNPKYNLKTRFYTFFNRLLGKKSVVLDSWPTVVVNRLSFFTHRISEGFKTVFFQTGIGQNLKSWLQISTKKSLQGIWDLTRAGGGQIVSEGWKPLFGLGIKTLKTIGEGLLAVSSGGLSKAFTFGGGLLRKGLGLITSGFGITGTFLGGISGGGPEDNQILKQIGIVVIGIFIIIPILFFLINTTTSTAFIEPTEISIGEIPLPIMAPLQCNSPRHLAEETICKLSQNSSPCNNNKINQGTWNSVDQCFQQISLTNKQAIRDEFNVSVSSLKSLQCVGFIKGIQKALGKEIIKDGNARDYLNPPYPPNYEFIQGNGAKPEKGDLAVWFGSRYGHIAVVVEVVGNIKMIVAQAWGDDAGQAGNIFLSESPYGGSNDGSPNGFLRAK